MRLLLSQLEDSLSTGNFYLSLFVALTIPDICGALEAPDGQASGLRYRAWYEKWARPQMSRLLAQRNPGAADFVKGMINPFTGDDCYRFRCSLLHQGSSMHPKSGFPRIMFYEPGAGPTMHYAKVNGILMIDIPFFGSEIITGAREWLDAVQDSEPFRINYDRFARRHDKGLSILPGVPVVG